MRFLHYGTNSVSKPALNLSVRQQFMLMMSKILGKEANTIGQRLVSLDVLETDFAIGLPALYIMAVSQIQKRPSKNRRSMIYPVKCTSKIPEPP